MAQLDGMRRYGENQNSSPGSSAKRYVDSPKTPASSRFANYSPKSPTTISTIEQLLQGSGGGRESYSRWPSTTSPTTASKSVSPVTQRQYDPREAHSPVLRKSSSVLARVKEKAKKWRRTLSNKKKPALAASPAPSLDVTLDDDGDHDHDEDQEEDPEYLGAPMYESELAPEVYKEAARQHPRAVHVVSEKHVSESGEKHPHASPLPDKTSTTATMQAPEPKPKPANEAEAPARSDAAPPCDTTTQVVTFKSQDIHVPNPVSTIERTPSSVDQVWDKGVSVKEYLMNKLEPGEDEKALSQIISDAISPRTSAGNVGVVEKMKVAVNSLLRSDQVSSYESPAPDSSSQNPASTDAREVVEEQNHGRVLKAN